MPNLICSKILIWTNCLTFIWTHLQLEPRDWILPTPLTNNKTTTSTTAAASTNFTPEILPGPVQPGEIRLHSWKLYTPQVPVLDLRGQSITSTLDLREAFHQLHLCPTEDNTQGESSPNCRRKFQKTKKSQLTIKR